MPDYHSNENWLPVVGYEELYEVSDQGRVRSLDATREYDRIDHHSGRTIHVCRRHRGRLLRSGVRSSTNRKGYLTLTLCRDDGQRDHLVHRLVLEAFIGPCPEGMEARHFPDNDAANNRLENLAWATHTKNCNDQVTHGTICYGERQGSSKLTIHDIEKIFSLRRNGRGCTQIGKMIGIHVRHVYRILNGERWAHTGHYESSKYRPAESVGLACE